MRKAILLCGSFIQITFASFAQETFEMVKDINPSGNGNPNSFTSAGGKLFFKAWDGVNGNTMFKQELWVSDGTDAGTNLVKAISEDSSFVLGSNIQGLNNYKDHVYFHARRDAGAEGLWKSDGTAAGTELVYEMPVFFNSFVYLDKLFLQGTELWVSDGTNSGTSILKRTNTTTGLASYPRVICELNGKLYFIATHENLKASLWESDGTEAGTHMVVELQEGVEMNPYYVVLDNKLIFPAGDHTGFHLWITDGTAAGTQKISDVKPGGQAPDHNFGFTIYDGKVYFPGNDGVHGNELWVSDGTAAGTKMVKDINPNTTGAYVHGSPTGLTVFNGKLYFSAEDGTNGRELWVTDGTEAGTKMVKDISSFLGSDPDYFMVYNGRLYFTAKPKALDRRLFRTDGTEEGTVMIEPANATKDNPCDGTRELYIFEDELYFTANFTDDGYELWKIKTTPTSIEKSKGRITFNVAPNPTSDMLNIFSESPADFVLFDLVGRSLKNVKVQGETTISLHGLPAGLYLLKEHKTGQSIKVVKY